MQSGGHVVVVVGLLTAIATLGFELGGFRAKVKNRRNIDNLTRQNKFGKQ